MRCKCAVLNEIQSFQRTTANFNQNCSGPVCGNFLLVLCFFYCCAKFWGLTLPLCSFVLLGAGRPELAKCTVLAYTL